MKVKEKEIKKMERKIIERMTNDFVRMGIKRAAARKLVMNYGKWKGNKR